MTDPLPVDDELGPDTTVGTTLIAAWQEALSARWVHKPFLVLLVAFMTVPFLPFWMILALLERNGNFDLDEGFSL